MFVFCSSLSTDATHRDILTQTHIILPTFEWYFTIKYYPENVYKIITENNMYDSWWKQKPYIIQ